MQVWMEVVGALVLAVLPALGVWLRARVKIRTQAEEAKTWAERYDDLAQRTEKRIDDERGLREHHIEARIAEKTDSEREAYRLLSGMTVTLDRSNATLAATVDASRKLAETLTKLTAVVDRLERKEPHAGPRRG